MTVTEDGILFTPDTEKWETQQTGTVTTCGGNLNVRTGAGLDNDAFTQLPDGAQVEVIGTEGEWVKVLLPEREGYVHSDYLTITDTGSFSLSLFLGLAMMGLKLWQLAELALPLMTLLGGQVVLMFLYAYFVIFTVMGRDYDAAVLSAGVCGFGMGATPNAMANMQAICEKYVPSVKAYLLIPLVGSLFADFLNSLAITFFINFL